MLRNALVTTPEHNIVVTNQSLISNPESGYVLAGRCFADGVNEELGGNQFAFELPENGQAVILSQSLKELFEEGNGHAPVSYLSRGEVQGDIPLKANESHLASSYRLLRIMPVLTIKQNGKDLMHLTLRGQGASDAGSWGCASSLLSTKINPHSIYATLNRETGLLIDGQIAVFEPAKCEDNSMNPQIEADAIATKKLLAKDVPALKSAFEQNADFAFIATKIELPSCHDNVYFYGGVMDGDVVCVAHDNQQQRTLTLIFPLVAEVPANAVLTAFNGEGYEGPSALVSKKFLKTESSMPLISGLRELVMGK